MLVSWIRAFKHNRKEPQVVVYDDQYGDIQSEHHVHIKQGSVVCGKISAPRITVAGIVQGRVYTRELHIEQTGQLWGDAFVASIEIATGGKMHGWVSTQDPGTVDLLRSGQISSGDLTQPPYEYSRSLDAVFDDLTSDARVKQEEDALDSFELVIRRQLRAEAAAAIVARKEIEATIEARISELVAERTREDRHRGLSIEPDQSDQSRKLEELDLERSKSSRNQENIASDDAQVSFLRVDLKQSEAHLKQSTEKLTERTLMMKRIMRLAAERISNLEKELKRAKQRLEE